ncbi:MAG: LytTR family DNA-binding domain-containing protein [Pseudomonadota bacterium]
MNSLRTKLFPVGFSLIAATLISFAGLFNTSHLGYPTIFIYWFGLVFIGFWLNAGMKVQLDAWLPSRSPWFVRWLVHSLCLSVPMFGLVIVAQSLVGFPVPTAQFVDLFGKVMTLTLALIGINHLRDSPKKAEASAKDPTPLASEISEPAHAVSAPPIEPAEDNDTLKAHGALSQTQAAGLPKLAQRLEPKYKDAEIWALGAEDHYVRVLTSEGDCLILLRLADAIIEVTPVEGARVHRSWWVADAGVASYQRRGDGGTITLKNEVTVPVSRANRPAFETRSHLWS